jgi:hypothetical protein
VCEGCLRALARHQTNTARGITAAIVNFTQLEIIGVEGEMTANRTHKLRIRPARVNVLILCRENEDFTVRGVRK